MKRLLITLTAVGGLLLSAPSFAEAGWRRAPVVVNPYYGPPVVQHYVYRPGYVVGPTYWYQPGVYVAAPYTVVRTWW